MSTVTREQVLERVAGLGPLQNVLLVAEDNDTRGLPSHWNPEIGLNTSSSKRTTCLRPFMTICVKLE